MQLELQSGITLCNTDPSAPFFLQNMQCLMVKVCCKFDKIGQKLNKLFKKSHEMALLFHNTWLMLLEKGSFLLLNTVF